MAKSRKQIIREYMRSLGEKRSEAKAIAARRNGLKGGRPKAKR